MKALLIIWALVGVATLGVYVYANGVVNEAVHRNLAEMSQDRQSKIQTINPQATYNSQEASVLQDTVAPYDNVRK